MPLYTFENVKNKKKEDFFFAMKDAPKVGDTYTDEEGQTWKRIFTVPNASIDTKVDPFSKSDFMKVTENKKGTMGDLLDQSQAMSEARAAKNGGLDPVKQKFYKEYAKTRNGKKHPNQLKEEAKKKLAEKGIELTN